MRIVIAFAITLASLASTVCAKDKPTNMESGKVVSVGSKQEVRGHDGKVGTYDVPTYDNATSSVVYTVAAVSGGGLGLGNWSGRNNGPSMHVGEAVQLYRDGNSLRIDVNGKVRKFNILGETAK